MLIGESNDKRKKRSTSTKARAYKVGYWKADKEESEKASKPKSQGISEKAHAYRVAHGAKEGPKKRSQIQINAAKLRAAKSGAKRRVESGKTSSSPSQYRSEVTRKYKERLSKTNPNNSNRYTDAMNAHRRDLASKGKFKGKYYGPDVFKGNIELVDKWRKAGSPNPRQFKKKQAK